MVLLLICIYLEEKGIWFTDFPQIYLTHNSLPKLNLHILEKVIRDERLLEYVLKNIDISVFLL